MPKGKIKKIKSKLKWGGTHPFFLHSFISNFTPSNLENKVILDVGCGKGINAYLIRVTRDLSGSTLVGLDINKDYLDFCKKYEDSHNSDWRSSDFKGFGYKVYGIGFKTTVLHNDPLLKIKQALYFFATPFAYFIPQISGILVCVKDY